MQDDIVDFPADYKNIERDTLELGFAQSSDGKIGQFLKVLCGSKVEGRFLELGTGSGLSTSWMLQGMDEKSTLLSVENDDGVLSIARKHLGSDPRVEFICDNGERVISRLEAASFDLIFADTWPGKYNHLEETLSLLKVGGFYVIDDMLAQDNWPDGHDKKAAELLKTLALHEQLKLVKMCWSTGIVLAVKHA
ncbi:MAG: class I SAM-dependent methyltransferase [Alteromonadaceae bacterium]|nr:class I SAM-dependent methyltransferase [Alteromonadaceae bacterium]